MATRDELASMWEALDEAGTSTSYAFESYAFDGVDGVVDDISKIAKELCESLSRNISKLYDMSSSYTGVSGRDFEDYEETMQESVADGESVEDAMEEDLEATGSEMLDFIKELEPKLNEDMDSLEYLQERVEDALSSMQQGMDFIEEIKDDIQRAIGR